MKVITKLAAVVMVILALSFCVHFFARVLVEERVELEMAKEYVSENAEFLKSLTPDIGELRNAVYVPNGSSVRNYPQSGRLEGIYIFDLSGTASNTRLRLRWESQGEGAGFRVTGYDRLD